MSIGLILLIVLLGLALGSVPQWSHSRHWGYAPSGVFGALFVVVLVLVLIHPA